MKSVLPGLKVCPTASSTFLSFKKPSTAIKDVSARWLCGGEEQEVSDEQSRSHVRHAVISHRHASYKAYVTSWDATKHVIIHWGLKALKGLSMDWAMLRLSKTTWWAHPEATQRSTFRSSDFFMTSAELSNNEAAQQWEWTGGELRLWKVSSKWAHDLWTLFQLQILLFSVSAEPLSALLSSVPMRDSRKVRKSHGWGQAWKSGPRCSFLASTQEGWLVMWHCPQNLPTSNRTCLCCKKPTLQGPAGPNKSLKLIQVLCPQSTDHFFSYPFVLTINHPTVMSKRRDGLQHPERQSPILLCLWALFSV